MPDWKAIDTAMTRWRKKIYHLLRNDLKIGAEKGCFNCQFYHDGDGHKGCNQSVSGGLASGRLGDWPYVGRQYGEARVGGKAARVLFVGMDRPFKGKEGAESSLDFRAEQMYWRCGAFYRGNPHMGGVDVELAYLLEDGTEKDDRCQQFALVNSVFCGPLAARTRKGKPSMNSRSSHTMKENCRKHLRRLLQALRPDIVIAQGDGPRDGLCALLSDGHERVGWWENRKSGRGHRTVELVKGQIEGGQPALFLLTGHPAYYPGFAWKKGRLPEELKRGLGRVREEYAGPA